MAEHLASERIDQLKQLKLDRENGILSGIPLWTEMPELGKWIPSLDKGQVILDAAASGVGKSMWARWSNVIAPWLYLIKHPETNINVKFVIFLLEDEAERFIDYMFSAFIYLKFGKEISPKKLNSKHRNELTELEVEYVDVVSEAVNDLLSHCIIEDSIYNSYGIYKTCRLLSEEWGVHYYTELINNDEGRDSAVITKEEYNNLKSLPKEYSEVSLNELSNKFGLVALEYKQYWKYSHYIPTDPNQHVITVVDNINCLSPDKREVNLKTAMDTLMYSFARTNITKHWRWTFVAVQQNVGSAEEQEFTRDGGSILSKLMPSLSDLGDSKLTQRACHLIYAVFDPSRYGVRKFNGYDIDQLGDRARFIFILKNNDGDSNKIINTLFIGGASVFRELPDPDYINYEEILKI